jgi:hypothetical protein
MMEVKRGWSGTVLTEDVRKACKILLRGTEAM